MFFFLKTAHGKEGEYVLRWSVQEKAMQARWLPGGSSEAESFIHSAKFHWASPMCQVAREFLEIKTNPCPSGAENLHNSIHSKFQMVICEKWQEKGVRAHNDIEWCLWMPRPVRNCISLLQVQKNRPLILMEKADFWEIMVWRESNFDFKIRDQFFSYSNCIT